MNNANPPTPLVRSDEDAAAEPRTIRTTPEAEEVSELARHGDPSQTKKPVDHKDAAKTDRGVAWVRPSELMSQAGGRVAGRGIDFHAELALRARRLPGETVRATRHSARVLSRRARRLPPVSAFGRSGQPSSATSRSGIGLR